MLLGLFFIDFSELHHKDTPAATWDFSIFLNFFPFFNLYFMPKV